MIRVALLMTAGLATIAWSRPVIIRWKAVEHSVRYELEVRHADQPVVQTKIGADTTRWRGALKPGLYSYRVRAIDRLDRPGEWSQPTRLMVAPRTPQLVKPKEGAVIRLENVICRVRLEWRSPDDAETFLIELSRNGIPLSPVAVQGRFWEMPDPEAGDYRYRVKAVVDTDVESEPTSWRTLTIETTAAYLKAIRRFQAPRPLWPLQAVFPPPHGQLTLQWEEVEGAEAYEIELREKASRELAAVTFKRFRTQEDSVTVPVEAHKAYVWTVRALAQVDFTGRASVTSETAHAAFQLDPNAPEGAPLPSRITLTESLSAYHMQRLIPSLNAQARPSGPSLTTHATAEIWPSNLWGLWAEVNVNKYRFNQQTSLPLELITAASYRLNLSRRIAAYVLQARLGLAWRDYLVLYPTGAAEVSTLGPWASLQVEKSLSRDWAFSLSAAYALPLVKITGPVIGLSTRLDNFRLLAQGRYQIAPHWELVGQIFLENRAMGFSGVGAQPEEVRIQHGGLGAGLAYRWD